MRITRRLGVSRVLDTVGGDNAPRPPRCWVSRENWSNWCGSPALHYPDAFMKGLSFHQSSLGPGHRHGDAGRQTLSQAATAMNGLLEQGKIRVAALEEIDLRRVGEALLAMRRQHTRGKIVMVGTT